MYNDVTLINRYYLSYANVIVISNHTRNRYFDGKMPLCFVIKFRYILMKMNIQSQYE